jgi:hypothetical protein
MPMQARTSQDQYEILPQRSLRDARPSPHLDALGHGSTVVQSITRSSEHQRVQSWLLRLRAVLHVHALILARG